MRLLTLSSLTLCFVTQAATGAEIDYHTDIAPIMRDHCAGCHNEFDKEGDFSVETYQSLLEGGESDEHVALIPGDAQNSYLMQMIRHEEKPVMPPKKEPQLADAQIVTLTEWIDRGAVGPDKEYDVSILSTLTVPEVAPSGAGDIPITAVEYSPDGKLLAIATFEKVVLQDTESGKKVREIRNENGKVNAVHFSSDGRRLVTASGISGLKGVATIWEVESGEKVRDLGAETHRDILFDAEFSPDGTMVATAGYDRVIRLWDSETGKYLRKFPSHNGAVYDLAFSPDGTALVSASGDSTGKVWDVASGDRLDTLNQPQGEQFRVAFSPDGKFIFAAGADNRIRMWRWTSKGKARINPLIHARFAHEDEVVDLDVSKDGKLLVSSSADRVVKLWSLPGLDSIASFPAQPDVVSALAFTPGEENFVVARMNGSHETVDFEIPNVVETQMARAETKQVQPRTAEKANPIMVEESGDDSVTDLALPAVAKGAISESGDVDEYRFRAEAGEEWIFEIDAARSKSSLDSRISILTADGEPVERVVLQAVRDSWLTFRGKDSDTSGDFRVQNWEEMELNEFLYINGEVVKLFHYPRGPDSGFLVYPGFGNRHSFFETTALSHPLGQPCYIVRAYVPGTEPGSNGLPMYRLYYENDDDSQRLLGKDSRLTFTAPVAGDYLVRVEDVRGFGGEGFEYKMNARSPDPDFSIKVAGKNPKMTPGSGREVAFEVERKDGFAGEIRIDVDGLPEGLSIPTPIVIEENQNRAFTTLHAATDFTGAPPTEAKEISLTAHAEVNGEMKETALGALGQIKKAKGTLTVEIAPSETHGRIADDGVLEFEIEPGETIVAMVKATRNGFTERIDFGKEDSGRNLPHGVYVDNIGLNGLMIPEGKDEQKFYLTAADWLPETSRMFHLRALEDGNHTTKAVRLRVVTKKGNEVAATDAVAR